MSFVGFDLAIIRPMECAMAISPRPGPVRTQLKNEKVLKNIFTITIDSRFIPTPQN